MSDAIYVGMSGAKQTMYEQVVEANNLANVSTDGFRADLQQAQTVVVKGAGYLTDAYAAPSQTVTDFSSGPIRSTGRNLDIAIPSNGFFVVQNAQGKEALTRRGDLDLNVNRQLVTSNGLAVMGNGGPIAIPPAESISIAGDGTISIVPQGAKGTQMVTIDRIKLVNPDVKDLKKGEDGLIYLKNGKDSVADSNVTLSSGALEGSNVNAVDSMVKMISLARNFELQVKDIQQHESQTKTLVQVMQLD